MHIHTTRGTCLLLTLLGLSLSLGGFAEDWPTYRGDAARSGVTQEKLNFPLAESWSLSSTLAPRPAWPASAPRDYWHKLRNLKPVVTYDRVYHAVAAAGRVFFATSADDRVCAVNAETGETQWDFFADAPIRLAPTYWENRLYVGSDDGWVYCLAADSGKLLWKHRPSPDGRRIPGNGRIVSLFPVRTGVLVDNGVAYYCAGLFPSQSVYAVALDAASGEEKWVRTLDNVSPQGYLLASSTRLFVPTGRTNPIVLNREDGASLGALESSGGSFAVLIDDAIATGPGRRDGKALRLSDPNTNESVATCEGLRMAVDGSMAYIQTKEGIKALDRPKFMELSRQRNGFAAQAKKLEDRIKDVSRGRSADKAEVLAGLKEELKPLQAEMARLDRERQACYIWETPSPHPYALIVAGNVLFAGGDDMVAAYRKSDGALLWDKQVGGRAYGLSVAEGRLIVSTDTGAIHSFGPAKTSERQVRRPVVTTPFENDSAQQAYADAAQALLQTSKAQQGYCVVLDGGAGRLAYELARQSDLHILVLEEDTETIKAARRRFHEAGLYGSRITFHQWDGKNIPYTTYMANLITRDGGMQQGIPTLASDEFWRVLRPYGGTIILPAEKQETIDALEGWTANLALPSDTVRYGGNGWAWLRRGAVPGAGEWTQLYSNAAHTAASTDEVEGPMTFQWFGEPGPKRIIDRHHRPMSPLFKDGRLFINGNEVLFGVDAYNGTPLWELETPGSRRIGALKNAGHVLVTDDLLYIATGGECWAVDVKTGVVRIKLPLPALADIAMDWGYLNQKDELLIGTAQKPGASFSRMSDLTCDMLEGDHRVVMMSDGIFAVDRRSGAEKWRYQEGAILNSGIAMAEGRVYFLESRNEKTLADKDGRIALRDFCKEKTFLTALDEKTGKVLWQRPVQLPFEHIGFLNVAEGVVLLSGTHNEGEEVYYAFHAADTATGDDVWVDKFRALDIRGNEFTGTEGSHGEQWQHPVLINGTIYSRPFAFNLHTGEKKDFIARRGGHGCGGLTGSPNYLFGRGDNPRMYPIDTPETEGVRLTHVSRPGCWLNIIPAGGLVLLPESSSGCTCSYPMQTSFAFIPQSVANMGRE
jgi:outer membrane protein assembly factor BamB